MTKKTFIILFVAAAILLIVSYCQFGLGPETSSPTTSRLKGGKSVVKATLPPVETSTAKPAPATGEATSSAGFLPTQMAEPAKFSAYQKSLKEMSECLNMKVGALDPKAEINFDYFNSMISADLGDIVTQNEEWTAVDLRTSSGEIRRIYVEYSGEETPPKKTLKYYAVGAGGERREVPLSKEQMTNPSEALIASLEKDGEVLARSVSRRIFYQNGDDLLLVERNGKIYSFQLPHDGKTYSCWGADTAATMTCQCK